MDEIPKIIGYCVMMLGVGMMGTSWMISRETISNEIFALGRHMTFAGAAVFVI